MTTLRKRLHKPLSSEPASSAPEQQVARLVPNMALSLMALANERGVSPELLCRGLGFSYESLQDSSTRMSHQQARALILRSLKVFDCPSLGLAVGSRQTPVSWGLPGLLMQTCETFGEAVMLGMAHQEAAGAMVHRVLQASEDEVVLALVPHVPDLPIERFLIEGAMSTMVAVFRALMNSQRNPAWVEFAYARPAYSAAYQDFFRCPVRFNAEAHRIAFDPHMFIERVPGHDPISCRTVRAQLMGLLTTQTARHELVETLSSSLRINVDAPPRQRKMAQTVNVSDRTLRRRLSQQDTSFSTLRDRTRYDQARELLTHSRQTIAQIAEALGYADPRAFRRAFKRWSGQLPTVFRDANPAQRGGPR